MANGIRTNCGLAGIVAGKEDYPAAVRTYGALQYLRHRGQDGYGIVSHRRGQQDPLYQSRKIGYVGDALPPKEWDELGGSSAVAQSRYKTAGLSGEKYLQPFLFSTRRGPVAFAHNGTIMNADALAQRLIEEGETFQTGRPDGDPSDPAYLRTISDSEVAGQMIAQEINGGRDIVSAIQRVTPKLIGGYNFLLLDGEGTLYAVRDPRGIKPLCWLRNEEAIGVFSESCVGASPDLRMEWAGDVEPGTITVVDRHMTASGAAPSTVALPQKGLFRRAFDLFEYVYFAHRTSRIDNVWVERFRTSAGRKFAKYDNGRSDMVVVPLPYSGMSYAMGHHWETERRFVDWLHRERDIRSYIEETQDRRVLTAKLKHMVIEANVSAFPRAYLDDDSTITATTKEILIPLLRKAGAKEIHARDAWPLVEETCPWGGVDMRQRHQHFKSRYPTREEQLAHLGLDSFFTLTVQDLREAANEARIDQSGEPFGHESFCDWCITRRNPFGDASTA